MPKQIEYKIIKEEECEPGELSRLGGAGDCRHEPEWGLHNWIYNIEIEVFCGDRKKSFNFTYQPHDRNNRLQYYSGDEVVVTNCSDSDMDVHDFLEEEGVSEKDMYEFTETLLGNLKEIAEQHAENELKRLLSEVELGSDNVEYVY